MKYRAKIYIELEGWGDELITRVVTKEKYAETALNWCLDNIEQVTGGHIEQYVYGIGWVVCEEDETND